MKCFDNFQLHSVDKINMILDNFEVEGKLSKSDYSVIDSYLNQMCYLVNRNKLGSQPIDDLFVRLQKELLVPDNRRTYFINNFIAFGLLYSAEYFILNNDCKNIDNLVERTITHRKPDILSILIKNKSLINYKNAIIFVLDNIGGDKKIKSDFLKLLYPAFGVQFYLKQHEFQMYEKCLNNEDYSSLKFLVNHCSMTLKQENIHEFISELIEDKANFDLSEMFDLEKVKNIVLMDVIPMIKENPDDLYDSLFDFLMKHKLVDFKDAELYKILLARAFRSNNIERIQEIMDGIRSVSGIEFIEYVKKNGCLPDNVKIVKN